MKRETIKVLIAVIICLLTAVSCQHQNENSDKLVYAKVTMRLDDRQNNTGPYRAFSSGVVSALVSAVPNTSAFYPLSTSTNLNNAYANGLLNLTDGTVTLSVPLNTSMRLVKVTYSSELTVAQMLAGGTVPTYRGISDAFTITADTTSKTVEISMEAIGGSGNTGPVTGTNFYNNSVIHSGFITGTITAGTGATSILVAFDTSNYSTATGTTSWTLQLPTGANTWKDGSSHTIRVRGQLDDGSKTTENSYTVRKGANRDINGDGKPDMMIAATGYSSNTGRVYIYPGDASGPDSSSPSTITGHGGGYLGNSLSFGDVNGDGYADAIIGEYYCGSGTGHVFIFYGSASGISTRDLDTSPCAGTVCRTILGESSSYFGKSVNVGDVNGDGYADVIVGGSNYDGGNGRAYVFHGSATGIASTDTTTANTTIDSTGAFSLGSAVAVGNINGDDYADVAISAPGTSANDGAVHIFNGSASGITATSTSSASVTISGESASAEKLGDGQMAFGDVNGDGVSDLVVGAWAYATNTGRAYIIHGVSTTGPSSVTLDGSNANTTLTGSAVDDQFGAPITCGDVNGDGYEDVLASAMKYNSYTGRAYIFHGSSAGITSTNLSSGSANATITGSATNVFLSSGSFSDYNGDGYADLVIGATGITSNTGQAYYFPGSSSGFSSVVASTSTATKYYDGVTANDNFGDPVR